MSEYKRLTNTKWKDYQKPDSEFMDEIYYRLAELEDKIEAGKLVELPFIAMIDNLTEKGKIVPTKKAQAFNGRYCVVKIIDYWKCPVIEVCSEDKFNREAAEARLKELEK